MLVNLTSTPTLSPETLFPSAPAWPKHPLDLRCGSCPGMCLHHHPGMRFSLPCQGPCVLFPRVFLLPGLLPYFDGAYPALCITGQFLRLICLKVSYLHTWLMIWLSFKFLVYFSQRICLPSFVGVKEELSHSCHEQGWRPINLPAHPAVSICVLIPYPIFLSTFMVPGSLTSRDFVMFSETDQFAFSCCLSLCTLRFLLPLHFLWTAESFWLPVSSSFVFFFM